MISKLIIPLLLSAFVIASGFGSAYVTSIRAPAVLQNQNTGALTTFTLNLTAGNGNVTVTGPAQVAQDTLQSAQQAVSFASSYLGKNESHYNFAFTISDNESNVSGPSGGVAFTLLTISAFEGRQLPDNFTVSGVIEQNGSVGAIGGMYDKVGAAKRSGLKYVILPYVPNDSEQYFIYYISQQVYGIPIVEAQNISQELQYVFNGRKVIPIVLNASQHENVNSLMNAQINCTECNLSAFGELSSGIISAGNATAKTIQGNFSTLKQEWLNNLKQDGAIAAKGYFYTSADLAFLQYIDEFVVANIKNLTVANATESINSVNAYCSSLVIPQMNSGNYEFIIGGNLRALWANQTLGIAAQLLNQTESTDGIIESYSYIAQAYGWCQGAGQLYQIATTINGTDVSISENSLKSAAAYEINKAKMFGNADSLYLNASLSSYNSGDYATSLYSAVYADVFDNQSLGRNMTTAQLLNQTLQNMNKTNIGNWPSEFGASAEFYINQANSETNISQKNSSVFEAYVFSELALGLQAANSQIKGAFAYPSLTGATQLNSLSNAVNRVSYEIKLLGSLLVAVVILLIVIFIVLAIVLYEIRMHRYGKTLANRQRRTMRRGRR